MKWKFFSPQGADFPTQFLSSAQTWGKKKKKNNRGRWVYLQFRRQASMNSCCLLSQVATVTHATSYSMKGGKHMVCVLVQSSASLYLKCILPDRTPKTCLIWKLKLFAVIPPFLEADTAGGREIAFWGDTKKKEEHGHGGGLAGQKRAGMEQHLACCGITGQRGIFGTSDIRRVAL